MTTYKKGQNLVLTMKDRMEEPNTYETRVHIDLEEVTIPNIEGYYQGAFIMDVKVVEEDYSDTPLTKVKKVYK